MFKPNVAIDHSEEGVIPPNANIDAGMKFGSSLPDDDITGANRFTAILLYAEALAFTIATVAAGAATFFMSHVSSPILRFRQCANG
jgi:hypothetical protein